QDWLSRWDRQHWAGPSFDSALRRDRRGDCQYNRSGSLGAGDFGAPLEAHRFRHRPGHPQSGRGGHRARRHTIRTLAALSGHGSGAFRRRDAAHRLRHRSKANEPFASAGDTPVLIARAPLRISLAGGGTDFESYYSKYGGVTLTATIDKYSYALLSPTDADSVQIGTSEYPGLRDLDLSGAPFEGHPAPFVLERFRIRRGASVFLTSELPPYAGMGTYSAGTVALIRAALQFDGEEALNAEEIAELACDIEIQGMRMPIGKQDAYAVALGGLNYFEFDSDGLRQEPLQLVDPVRRGFEGRLMLFFTGRTQRTSDGLAEYKRSTERNRATVVSALHDIKTAATKLRRALELGDLDDVGPLLNHGWSASRQLGRGISDAWMEQWYAMARSAGADGGGTAGF